MFPTTPKAPTPLTVETLISRVRSLKQLFFEGTKPYLKVGEHHFRQLSDTEAQTYIACQMTDEELLAAASNMIPEAMKRMQLMRSLQLELDKYFEQQKYYLNLQNGIIDIRTGGLYYGNSQEFRFDYQYNFQYRKNKTLDDSPNFKHYCETSVGTKNIACFLRILAYILSSLTDAKKCCFWIGDGNTGKSMFADLLEEIMGEEVVSSEPFEALGKEQSRAVFRGKRLNISREAKRSVLRNEAAYKSIVSNEKISGRLLYQNSITYLPHIKLLVASNQPVEFAHPDDAIFDRMVIVFFHSTLRADQLDRGLKDKLWEERDVICSLALDTLPDLIQSGYDFKMSEESLNYLHACKNQLHTVEDFLAERCEISERAEIPTSVLHEAYLKFCRRNDYEPVGRNTFYGQIQWFGGAGISRIKTYDKDGTRVQGFRGIKLKKVLDTESKQEKMKSDNSTDSSLQRLARPPP